MLKFYRQTYSTVLHLLALILAAQTVLGQIPDPVRFENDIQAFEAQDLVSAPRIGAIVLTGSSSIARWNNASHAALEPLTVIPRGFGGSIMNDVLHYLDRVALTYEPRAIVIYEGDNDTAMIPAIPNSTIIEQLREIITIIHQQLPETRVYILSVKPSVLRQAIWPLARQLNEEYKALASTDPLVHYVDVATPLLQADGTVMTDIFIDDKLHLNAKGNSIWGRTIKAALMPLEAQFETQPE